MDSKQYLNLFEKFLHEKAQDYFPPSSSLNEAIRYSLLAEGKRIRPLFCLGFSHAFSGNIAVALRCALAVEMIHAYSLIHDDLPAMDNDDFRRGKLTNHKVFGEALAILAGDSLVTAAPEILINELQSLKIDPNITLSLTAQLLSLSGHNGMIKGQSLDMEAEKNTTDSTDLEKNLKTIHQFKTGKLIVWSCLAGLCSTSNQVLIQKQMANVTSLAEKFGLLFQIVDDILDVTSNLKDLGKTPGKDHRSGKLTYTSLYGIQGAKNMAYKIVEEIYHGINQIPEIRGKDSIILGIIQQLKDRITDTNV